MGGALCRVLDSEGLVVMALQANRREDAKKLLKFLQKCITPKFKVLLFGLIGCSLLSEHTCN